MRILALVTLATIVAGLFGGELLDPIGVPGIWFPFGIGVSRTQYVYAIALPLLGFLRDKVLKPIGSGAPRRELLSIERPLVEKFPGPLNHERWAGDWWLR